MLLKIDFYWIKIDGISSEDTYSIAIVLFNFIEIKLEYKGFLFNQAKVPTLILFSKEHIIIF